MVFIYKLGIIGGKGRTATIRSRCKFPQPLFMKNLGLIGPAYTQ